VTGGCPEGDLRLKKTTEIVITLDYIFKLRVTIAAVVDDERSVKLA
jgi:hypothetical protein